MTDTPLGKRLRERRNELDFTLEKVAKGSGLGTGTISDLEQGRQKATTKLHRIADILGVRIAWLESGEGPKLAAAEVREESQPYSAHGLNITPEGARVGAEWDKIEGDEYKQLAREFIESLVAAQKRASRRPGTALSTSSKKADKSRRSRARLD